jgi:hypothetical protein
MMRFEYDPQLVEQTTFLAARSDPEKECAMHELLDPLYKIGDAELRQRAFREVYGELFRRFGLDQIVPAYARTFPLLSGRLGRCIVREAERRRAQSADLYRDKTGGRANNGEQVLIIALCPECLLDQDRLRPWLYRQLRHIEDMVDEGFAYECDLPAAPAVQQNLIRDRYAVLWDIFVEGRLIQSERLCNDGVGGLWLSFSKSFARDGRTPPKATFERLMASVGLTHAQLLAWATEPCRLLDEGIGGSNDHDDTKSGTVRANPLPSKRVLADHDALCRDYTFSDAASDWSAARRPEYGR